MPKKPTYATGLMFSQRGRSTYNQWTGKWNQWTPNIFGMTMYTIHFDDGTKETRNGLEVTDYYSKEKGMATAKFNFWKQWNKVMTEEFGHTVSLNSGRKNVNEPILHN